MKRILSLFVLTVLYISTIPSVGLAAGNEGIASEENSRWRFEGNYVGGLISSPESEAEINEKAKESLKKVVKPNSLGLSRINEERRKKGLAQIKEAEIQNVTGIQSAYSPESTGTTVQSASMYSASPSYVDNSKLKYFPPIWDQGMQGSCVAFSSTYYQLTHMTAMAKNWDVKNDPENKLKFSPKWTYNINNMAINSAVSDNDVYNMMKNKGCLPLSDYPYNPYEPDYKEWPSKSTDYIKALNYRISNWGVEYIGPSTGSNTLITGPSDSNIQKIKSRLINGEVLTFGTDTIMYHLRLPAKDNPDSTNDTEFIGKDIVYTANERSIFGHKMTIVGFNDDVWTDIDGDNIKDNGELGVFIIANSSGTNYGYGGFFYIAYDALNITSAVPGYTPPVRRYNCMSMGTKIVKYNYIETGNVSAPKYIAEVNLNAKIRNSRVSFGVTDASSSTPPSTYKDYNLCPTNKIGDRSFDGTYDESSAGFAFDITDLVSGDMTNKKVWIRVSDYGESDFLPTTLNDFQIVDMTSGKTVQSLDIRQYGDGNLDSSTETIKQTAVTGLPYNNLGSNTEVMVSSKTDGHVLPYYLINANNLKLTKVTIQSPSRTVEYSPGAVSTDYGYNLFKGYLEFSSFNFERGNYNIKFTCQNNYGTVTYSKSFYCSPKSQATGNLALNKPVTASVSDWQSETPDKAVNGTWNNISDKWCTGFGKGNGSWLVVDLGEPMMINRWFVMHEKGAGFGYDQYFTKAFSLEASYDNVKWKAVDIVSNNTAGVTNRYLPQNIYVRYLRLKISTADIDNVARIYEFQLYYDLPVSSSGNIAKNKSASASVENYVFNGVVQSPSKALNGTWSSTTDKWCTGPDKGNGSWLMVDLGRVHEINRWKVINEKGAGFSDKYNRSCGLQVSPDGINDWKYVDSIPNNTEGIIDRSISEIESRYIRLTIDTADIDNVARIYEFQLYKDI